MFIKKSKRFYNKNKVMTEKKNHNLNINQQNGYYQFGKLNKLNLNHLIIINNINKWQYNMPQYVCFSP